MAKRIILSDESINSYGFWVKTDGIDLKQFKRNPIMLWNHNRSYRDDTNTMLPIGKWINIEVKDGVLSAEPSFDLKDDFAKKIAEKYEQGIVSMASIGIDVIETSESKEHLKQGQTRMTVLKSKLREASVVDIGSNDNAVALYSQDGSVLELSASGDCAIGLINTNSQPIMEKLFETLGLTPKASEGDAIQQIVALQNRAKAAEDQLQALQAQIDSDRQKHIESLVDAAVKDGRLLADKKTAFLSIGKTAGAEALTEALSALSAPVKPSGVIGHSGNTPQSKTFGEHSAAELAELRQNDQASYIALYEAQYGFKPQL